MNTGDCLKFQYEIKEQLRDDEGQPQTDPDGLGQAHNLYTV